MTDWLVGGVAALIGIAALTAALSPDNQWAQRWSPAKLIFDKAGAGAMRFAYLALAMLMIWISYSILIS